MIERLNAQVARSRVVQMRAPGGYGKSVLLEAWASRWAETPLARLTLCDGDAHRARLDEQLLTAFRDSDDVRLRALGGDRGAETPEAALAGLINGLAEVGEAVLILDGYQCLTQPASREALSVLLTHQPPQLHLILAGRGDPGVPLARFRVRAQLSEVGWADLSFTGDEVAAYAAAVSTRWDDGEAGRVHDLTLGWPRGVQLLLSARDPARAVHAYFEREMAGRASLRGVLQATAHLETLTAESWRAATGRDDGQAFLEALDNAGLMVLPLDDSRAAWRYHPLFAAFLAGRVTVFCGAR